MEARKGAAGGPSPGQLVPIGVDVLLDGILIGIAMTTGLKQGVLLTIALTLELFSLGLTMALEFGTSQLLVRVLAPTGYRMPDDRRRWSSAGPSSPMRRCIPSRGSSPSAVRRSSSW